MDIVGYTFVVYMLMLLFVGPVVLNLHPDVFNSYWNPRPVAQCSGVC